MEIRCSYKKKKVYGSCARSRNRAHSFRIALMSRSKLPMSTQTEPFFFSTTEQDRKSYHDARRRAGHVRDTVAALLRRCRESCAGRAWRRKREDCPNTRLGIEEGRRFPKGERAWPAGCWCSGESSCRRDTCSVLRTSRTLRIHSRRRDFACYLSGPWRRPPCIYRTRRRWRSRTDDNPFSSCGRSGLFQFATSMTVCPAVGSIKTLRSEIFKECERPGLL